MFTTDELEVVFGQDDRWTLNCAWKPLALLILVSAVRVLLASGSNLLKNRIDYSWTTGMECVDRECV
jgi:hypothetical protein